MKTGDRVVAEFEVGMMTAGVDFCNVEMVKKAVNPGDVSQNFWLNARQVRKVAEEKPVVIAVGDYVLVKCQVSGMGYGNVRLETDELGSPNPVPFWVPMDKVQRVP